MMIAHFKKERAFAGLFIVSVSYADNQESYLGILEGILDIDLLFIFTFLLSFLSLLFFSNLRLTV
jgi:hypothetical protein